MAIRGVIFDVGGVLVESPFVAALRWRDELGIPDEVMGIMFAEYASLPEPGADPPMWHRVETGHLELDTFVTTVREQFASHLKPDHPAMRLRGADFNVFRDAGAHWPMIHAARDLRRAGLRTAILTNNVKEWAEWRDVIALEHFEVVVDSSEVGLRKPDPAIWHLTLERMNLEPHEALFLDDHPENVTAASDLGLRSVLVTPDIAAAVSDLHEAISS